MPGKGSVVCFLAVYSSVIEPKIPLRAVACLQKIQGVAVAPMPLPSPVVALRPSDSAQPRLQNCRELQCPESTWDHMAGDVSRSQEFTITWIAVILGVTPAVMSCTDNFSSQIG